MAVVQIPLNVHEHDDMRDQQFLAGQWGTGWMHLRFLNVPDTWVDDYKGSDQVLDLGAVIPQDWIDTDVGVKAADPRLQSIEIVESGLDDRYVKLGFLEIDAQTESSGYAVCNGPLVAAGTAGPYQRIVEGQHETQKIVHGVALAADSTGIPAKGDAFSGSTAITDPICWRVDIDAISQHGRALVTAYYNILVGPTVNGYFKRQ